MAVQLQNVPAKLNSLSSKLRHDTDIQTSIDDISAKACAVATVFKTTMADEGSRVLSQKSLLMTSFSSTDVRITKMKSALNAAIKALTDNRQHIVHLQTDIHSNIEICRGRKIRHEADLLEKQSKISSLRLEIKSLEDNVIKHEDDTRTLENGAEVLDIRAEEVRRSAREMRENAGFGGFLRRVLVGVFTGGTSLVFACAVAGIQTAIDVNNADDCERNASRLRDEAESKRNQAQNLRYEKGLLEHQMSSLRSEIGPLQSSTENLSEASNVLQEVTDFHRSLICDIDNVLTVIQNMDTAMTDASLQTDSFEIFQNVFAAHPRTTDSRAKFYIDQLKDKWTQVETVMLQHGAKGLTY